MSAGVFELIHGNQLEALADHLAERLDNASVLPLQPIQVIVPHPDVARWIKLRIAKRYGVCANILFPLPAAFAWQLLDQCFGPLPKVSSFTRPVMTWRIHELLPEMLRKTPRDSALRVFSADDLSGPIGAKRLYKLAARFADLYDQYLVYRPDWLQAWENGEELELGTHEFFQAELWRQLSASEENHRGRLVNRLFSEAHHLERKNQRLPQQIFCFAISQLAPVYLDILRLLSRTRQVTLYQFNPSLHYWADLKSDK